MKITYRKAYKRDLDSLFELAVQFTEFNAKKSGKRRKFFFNGWKKHFKKQIQSDLSNTNVSYFIAFDEELNTAIGYILSRKCKDLFYYCVDELFVLPKYRKQSVGKKLIRMVLRKGKSYGLPIRVEVFTWNERAKTFYQNMGFTEDSIVYEYSRKK